MGNKKIITVETKNYIERPSKKVIDSSIIKVVDPDEHQITCVEMTRKHSTEVKLILTLLEHRTQKIVLKSIPFSLIIKNTPTNSPKEKL